MNRIKIAFLATLMFNSIVLMAQEAAEPESILTVWGENVTAQNVWQEYPRPQLQREEWKSLNGLWDVKIAANDLATAKTIQWEDKILVPFTVETKLSGINKQVKDDEAIFYHRSISIEKGWKDKKILLNFDASDHETKVWIDDKYVGSHEGGYSRFTFDITDHVADNKEHDLTVKVFDPQKSIFKSLGKQANASMHYERCSGIWQSVWMEPVDETAFISGVKQTPTLKAIHFEPQVEGSQNDLTIKYEIFDAGTLVKSLSAKANEPVNIEIPQPILWSPDTPFLYDTKISLYNGKKKIDEVTSYFGLRTVEKSGKDFLLNGKPVFQVGPLDQNYWPGGGMTPPSEEAMLWEANYLKEIGCNMVRLHIKQNPDRFYYNCDKLGLLVWQDFICGQWDNRNPVDAEDDDWQKEQENMMDQLHNFPSIVQWITFNESWGQHDDERVLKWAQSKDTTRLYTLASGWDDIKGKSDIRDLHDYTMRPAIPTPDTEDRIVVIGEGGGFASAVPAHNWTGRNNKSGEIPNPLFGGFNPEIPRDTVVTHDMFRPTFTTGKAFEKQYGVFVKNLKLLKNSGLKALVYTQLTDMKLEENGWLTFDRKVSKIDKDALREMHSDLINKSYKQEVLLENSIKTAKKWKTAHLPFPEKQKGILDAKLIQELPDLKALVWEDGLAPFGNTDSVNTIYDGKDQLFTKKNFALSEIPKNLSVRIYSYQEGSTPWVHARIYINGVFVADETTRQKMPEMRIAEVILPKGAMKHLKKGENEIIIQWVPGLKLQNGRLANIPTHFSVDASITIF